MTISKLQKMQRKIEWDSGLRIQRSPDSVSSEMEKALQAHVAGEYEEVIDQVRSLENWEEKASAWRFIGHAELGLGNASQALSAHRKARELNDGKNKKSAEDEINIASAHAALKEYDKALRSAKRALQLAPRMFTPWMTIIGILNRQKQYDNLDQILKTLKENVKDLTQHPTFLDHLENDMDFIGVKDRMIKIQTKRG